jgi:hypothetical protein
MVSRAADSDHFAAHVVMIPLGLARKNASLCKSEHMEHWRISSSSSPKAIMKPRPFRREEASRELAAIVRKQLPIVPFQEEREETGR